MSKEQRLAKRREVRTKQRSQERKDLFTCDYIKHKYPAIHAEAVQIYEVLINQYPDKNDLRKTEEHKLWKTRGILTLHPALNICQVPPDAQLRVFFPEPTTPNLESTTMNLEATIPEPPNLEATIPEPPNLEATIPEPPSLEATIPEPPNPKPPTPPKGKIAYKDNMQLIIPLMKSPVKHPGVITETLQIVTEEIVQEPLQSIDQIGPEILDQLITELRADPDLGSIFKDMEQQAEFEELDIDMNIDMDTRLEDELENWEFW